MAECLAKRPVGMGSDVQILSQLDTLYSHRRTIDATDVSNLVNNGIPVSYAYQGLGDRVIIPAGCVLARASSRPGLAHSLSRSADALTLCVASLGSSQMMH